MSEVRKRDFLLLAVSAGVGLQCTGDAIGHSFRILAKQVGSATVISEFGNVVVSLATVMTVAIWHTAFSRSKYKAPQKSGGDANPVVSALNTHLTG